MAAAGDMATAAITDPLDQCDNDAFTVDGMPSSAELEKQLKALAMAEQDKQENKETADDAHGDEVKHPSLEDPTSDAILFPEEQWNDHWNSNLKLLKVACDV